ncbi:MAG: trans-aconitate 2-methyltransferase, partial [Actinomycetota bacterium]
MTTWDPGVYSAFAQPRLRPALDLLARVGAEAPAQGAALGCGPGNVTPQLQAPWPSAHLTRVDSSPPKLKAAAEDGG